MSKPETRPLAERWSAAFPDALAAWSPYTRLKAPLLLDTSKAAAAEGLTGSFAMIRLVDQTVVIDLQQVRELGIENYAVEVLAHEIGHHVYAPASITDHTRSLARMLPALPTVTQHAPMIANLYTDLLINDRLMRSAGLRMPELMQAVVRGNQRGEPSKLWILYLRIYELLWGMERGSLCGKALPPREPRRPAAVAGSHSGQASARIAQDNAADAASADTLDIEVDARLASRLVRHHARHWLAGVGRFAVLVLPYLIEDAKAGERLQTLMDTKDAGRGGQPEGMTDMDPEEFEDIRHPGADDALADDAPVEDDPGKTGKPGQSKAKSGTGQARDPFQYGELLRLAGLTLDAQDAAIRYYGERARPYLVPFPSLPAQHSEDPLPEGLDPWEAGDPIDQIDWRESLVLSPVPIPGLTTVQRRYGTQPGFDSATRPLDLDVYVDSSGSMPDPRRQLSWPALAGAVICLSALRAGAAVQVTLWASRREVTSTKGFVRSAEDCLRVLTGYYGGGTQFPLPTLRETHAGRVKLRHPTHILVVSDDGASTMFDSPDERGTPGIEVCARALKQAAGGGTLALNIPADWDRAKTRNNWQAGAFGWLARAREEQGWLISPVATLPDLLGFAQAFARRHYGPAEG
ncbi:MAG: VWA domain-containing protein [Rhodanobacteraceae bacterium]|nr:VWA domain-containing protein [Rhodanobacteraceae bacterium]